MCLAPHTGQAGTVGGVVVIRRTVAKAESRMSYAFSKVRTVSGVTGVATGGTNLAADCRGPVRGHQQPGWPAQSGCIVPDCTLRLPGLWTS